MLDEFGVLSLDDEAIATDEEDSFSQLAGFSTCVSPSSQRYSLVSSLLLDSIESSELEEDSLLP